MNTLARMELTDLIVLFLVGNLAGMLNVMAGGGSALTLPTLIMLGLDPTVANGTNRIAIMVQNISATLSFGRQQFSDFNVSLKLAVWTLPGAITGALLASRISDEWFQRVLGLVLIGVVISMVVPRRKKTAERKETNPVAAALSMLGIGFYGGFIQVGVGFLLMAALFYVLSENLVRVNMHKVVIVLIYTVPALCIFIWSGNIAWIPGIALAFGNSLGGWWGAYISVKRGEKIIRIALMVALIIISFKMFDVF